MPAPEVKPGKPATKQSNKPKPKKGKGNAK